MEEGKDEWVEDWKGGREEEGWKIGRVEAQTRIDQAPAVRKVYSPFELQTPKHQRCERYIA